VDAASDEQFSPRKKHGRIYGRGACDTKGSVAAMLSAVLELAGRKQRLANTEIIFLGLVDEETGQGGSRRFAASGIKADLAIVGEPTKLQVVTAHKGNLWLQLETQGRAAHGSCPELGRNAVHEMARIVDVLETKYAAQLRKRRHPLLGAATVNVGTINGGVQANIVPAHCSITIDRRTIPGETDAGVWRELRQLLQKNHLRATLASTKGAPCLPMETNPKLPLVREFMRSAGQAKATGVMYFCDASVLAQGGIPSVVFGPGDIAQAHTADEWISLDSLEQGKQMLVNYLSSLP
jgi:acetylornithine deacetylase